MNEMVMPNAPVQKKGKSKRHFEPRDLEEKVRVRERERKKERERERRNDVCRDKREWETF
jgi:hypothetical protein